MPVAKNYFRNHSTSFWTDSAKLYVIIILNKMQSAVC
jgi:hypothetical protein